MMAENWRDSLRPSSFRGVPFEVRAREGQTGRRGPDHDYPDRDQGYPEDTGKSPRHYKVEAFLLASTLGGDYLPARNRLLTALERKGPGEYIDPWGESWLVQVRSVSWRESIDQGGHVVFSIDFVEYARPVPHIVTIDTVHAVRQAGAASRAGLVAAFTAGFTVGGNDAAAAAAAAAAALDRIESLANGAATANRYNGGVSSLLDRARAIRDGLPGGAGAPDLGAALSDQTRQAVALHATGWPRYQAARGLLDHGGDFAPIRPTTPRRARAAANQAAMIDLMRGLAAVEMALAATDIRFAVHDEAIAVRDQLATALDERMMTAPDDVHHALATLRAAAIRDITARGADLSRLSTTICDADIPAVVLAYRLYGDAGRDSEVLARNPAIRHPGLIPGGLPLKVPTHD